MARVRPRTALAVLAATLAASVGGGYAWSRINGSGESADDSVVVEQPGVYDEPGSIVTAPELSGDPLPDVELLDLSGNAVAAPGLAGRPMVINIWFSTCVPCEQELPDFAKVHGELGDEVRFVGVNLRETAEVTERFATARGVHYELLRDDTGDFVAALEIAIFPATLFVDAAGNIVELRQGALDAEELRSTIEEVLQ